MAVVRVRRLGERSTGGACGEMGGWPLGQKCSLRGGGFPTPYWKAVGWGKRQLVE